MPVPSFQSPGLPAVAGVGLRAPHFRQVLDTWPEVGWFEVHSENFFGPGGEPLRVMEAVRQRYPVSLHGVGLSLGSSDELSQRHLEKLKVLVDRIEPAAVSEHLCWSSVDGRFFNDLLPLPYTEEALATLCERIDCVQQYLGRTILVENVSSYVRFAGADMPEWTFLAELARRTGCQLLLDVNNIFVSASNHGFNAHDYLGAIPPNCVGEIHLAGYEIVDDFLVDTHSRPVYPAVWDLFAEALASLGPRPTLIEWDNDIPAFDILHDEMRHADRLLEAQARRRHVRAA
jgi:hypothetical protein